MDWPDFALFFAASWILIVTPGPDIVYVVTRGISQGRKAGMVSAAGVTMGILVHTVFASLGLAVILRTSALAFLAVKFAGAAYLVYLGIKAFMDRTEFAIGNDKPAAGTGTIFVQGVLSNVLNPKVALFFLAFLPQFVNPRYGDASVQMVGLGLTFAFFGFVFLVVLGYSAGGIGLWLARMRRIADKIRLVTGSILVLLGLRLAFMEQK